MNGKGYRVHRVRSLVPHKRGSMPLFRVNMMMGFKTSASQDDEESLCDTITPNLKKNYGYSYAF